MMRRVVLSTYLDTPGALRNRRDVVALARAVEVEALALPEGEPIALSFEGLRAELVSDWNFVVRLLGSIHERLGGRPVELVDIAGWEEPIRFILEALYGEVASIEPARAGRAA